MQAHYLPQQDPETLRQDREAFEGICHAMSEYVSPTTPCRRAHRRRDRLEEVPHLMMECSDVVDVFTAAPNQVGFGSRVQSMDHLHIGNRAKAPAKVHEAQCDEQKDMDTNLIESKPPVPQEMAYRSVRKMPNGLPVCEMDKDETEAAGGPSG